MVVFSLQYLALSIFISFPLQPRKLIVYLISE